MATIMQEVLAQEDNVLLYSLHPSQVATTLIHHRLESFIRSKTIQLNLSRELSLYHL